MIVAIDGALGATRHDFVAGRRLPERPTGTGELTARRSEILDQDATLIEIDERSWAPATA